MANEVAPQLRTRTTPQEVRVWLHLRALRPRGLHVRRHVPLQTFIVDFACKQAKRVVEIDGAQHGVAGRRDADDQRDRTLGSVDYKVLRFWNIDVARSLESVIDTIFSEAMTRLP